MGGFGVFMGAEHYSLPYSHRKPHPETGTFGAVLMPKSVSGQYHAWLYGKPLIWAIKSTNYKYEKNVLESPTQEDTASGDPLLTCVSQQDRAV